MQNRGYTAGTFALDSIELADIVHVDISGKMRSALSSYMLTHKSHSLHEVRI